MLFNSIDFAVFLTIAFLLYWIVARKNIKIQDCLKNRLLTKIFIIEFASENNWLIGSEKINFDNSFLYDCRFCNEKGIIKLLK